jgi:hypothetical protein
MAKRNWARNKGTVFAVKRAMKQQPLLNGDHSKHSRITLNQ